VSADAWVDTIARSRERKDSAPKASIIDPIARVLAKGDGQAAVRRYRELKARHAAEYEFSEAEVNALGYYLLRKGRSADAVAFFQLNVEEHPQSFNAYDSLAEVYMKNGEKALAIKNYRKFLELNPANANAVEMLKTLGANE
jgi:Tfp pilus assembly protein PilF